MKKTNTFFLPAIIGFSLFLPSCSHPEEVIPAPEPLDKTVVFQVYGQQDFSYSQFGEEKVTVELVISRMNKDVADAAVQVVFDSTFTMALKDIPVRANRLYIRKTIPAVLDSKEEVHIGTGYTYRQSSFGKNQTFPAGQQEKQVELIIY
ncbi:hypothetical protein [Pontibacter ramchanderi]|uniref:Lipoprotein n=1 Tax=Pontibacter ramchanderi TaxID=1179743 RepID=A0A2N3UB81_9BACT|nr:hypothetical protein [Pontibacter ramchanderi]PKV66636.1 hypothetical protein BD749_1766 [Pontibacter ramchanderi]